MKVFYLGSLIALICFSGFIRADTDSSRIAELEREIAECKDPLKIRPSIFKEILLLRGTDPPPDVKKMRGITGQGMVHIFVDSVLYPDLQISMNQFTVDLQAEGYQVSVTLVSEGTSEDIRSILQSEYDAGLIGVILIGDVPTGWMETHSRVSSHFPTDYFYMDLDGVWADDDGDGFYDEVSGNTYPEIWAGRLSPSQCLFGDEVDLLNAYFAKNHAYRTGDMNIPDRGLAYLEVPDFTEVGTYLGWVYDDPTVVFEENTTTALHYKSMTQEGYEWIHLLAHSSPWGHTFLLQDETYGGGSIFNYEIPLLNPKAVFLLLNACSSAKYTETNNIGQSYLFGSDYVCAIIGETKLMYGTDFEEFYSGLQSRENLGEAFLYWMWDYYEWFWGCHIFGDPTLKIHNHGHLLGFGGHTSVMTEEDSSDWHISPVSLSPFTDGNPSACVDHFDRIWVAWNAGRDIRANIYTSHNDGMAWSEPEVIAFSESWDYHPCIEVDESGKVWILWQSYRQVENDIDGYDIYGIYNDDEGWSDPIQITTALQYDVEPKVAVDSSGNLWAVWRTERKQDSDIMYSYCRGSVWTAGAYLTNAPAEDRDPVITVDTHGQVWVVWASRKNGNWDLYARFFNGFGWSPEMRVTTDPGYDLQPAVTADVTGRVWIVWRSNRTGNLDIFAAYYDGANWSSAFQVTQNPAADLCPCAGCVDGQKVSFLWQSNRDGEWRIYSSVYDGDWSNPEALYPDAGEQIHPEVISRGKGPVDVVFQSNQGENWDVQYGYWMNGRAEGGDVNRNGRVDVLDVLCVVNHILGEQPLTGDALIQADCNSNGQIDVLDALGIVNVILGDGECVPG